MRLKYAVAAAALLTLPVGSAMADSFWRNVLSSGATTGSTYLTFKKDRKVIAAQDDAGSFVASNGEIRGPYLESAPLLTLTFKSRFSRRITREMKEVLIVT